MEQMMNDYSERIKQLKTARQRHIKSLSKILNLLYKKEWELSENSLEIGDNICKIASKSVSEASGCIQTAISRLVSTEITDTSTKKEEKKNSDISQLKKIVLNKK